MTTKHLPGPWMILGTPVSPIPPELFPVLIGVEDTEIAYQRLVATLEESK